MAAEPPVKRTIAFVDGQNLFHAVKSAFGWHVYGLEQPPGGPTPLRVTLDENGIVLRAGATSGSAPIKKQDQSFNLETQFYSHSFVLHVPIQVKPGSPRGKQSVPVSVRFQACSDRMCLPPRTVHVSVPIEIPER